MRACISSVKSFVQLYHFPLCYHVTLLFRYLTTVLRDVRFTSIMYFPQFRTKGRCLSAVRKLLHWIQFESICINFSSIMERKGRVIWPWQVYPPPPPRGGTDLKWTNMSFHILKLVRNVLKHNKLFIIEFYNPPPLLAKFVDVLPCLSPPSVCLSANFLVWAITA